MQEVEHFTVIEDFGKDIFTRGWNFLEMTKCFDEM
jgi:hypothetical protein